MFVALIAFDAFLFSTLGADSAGAEGVVVRFLDVGQGDAALVEFPGGIQALVDGGPPGGRLLEKLAEVMGPTDRYIDLVFLSHPQLDHYGGLVELVRRFRVGMFFETGVEGETEGWATLVETLEERDVRRVVLSAGDRVRYGADHFTVISPDAARIKKELNDTSMVLSLETGRARLLFTGDIDAETERELTGVLSSPIDVLKVAHHGSKFSSAAEFLSAVKPALAVIGVGKNSYGHPTEEALARLEAVGARVYRTDRDGMVTVWVTGDSLRVFLPKADPPLAEKKGNE